MRIEAIPIGNNPPHDINVIVEVPIGGEPVKYEMDKDSGAMFVDRILYTSMRYPGNYGFVPHTLSDDGDPIDVLIANQRPLIPGAVINCKPVGVLLMKDEAGEDAKVIAVPVDEVTGIYRDITSVEDLDDMLLDQIVHFFEHYKDLEKNKWVRTGGWQGVEVARQELVDAEACYQSLPVKPAF